MRPTPHVMYAGTVVEAGPVVDVFHRANHPYTEGLLASLPRLDRPERELVPIGGMPPSLRNLGSIYTLVLLNGRRVAPFNTGSTVNLEQLPLAP